MRDVHDPGVADHEANGDLPGLSVVPTEDLDGEVPTLPEVELRGDE